MSLNHQESVLIVNRAEIACRVIKTAKMLGIKSYSLYSFPDRDLPHTKLADKSFPLGDSDSYLNIPEIITIIKRLKPTYIHPGYGFLSESAELAKEIKKTSSIFLGPDHKIISLMGDKIASKQLAKELNIPVIPDITISLPINQKTILKQVSELGLPVIVKASNGGGGKGMKIVRELADLESAVNSATRESKAFFNSEALFCEKLIGRGRHIEVQVLADKYGNVHILGDRDCTYQRSNQKIIEESPAPFIDDSLREKLHKFSYSLAKKSKYQGVGTCEFMVTPNKECYFLELNSRIQVEHPITEETTGLDIVELQFEVGRGTKLTNLETFKKHKISNHSIELRVCAESTYNNFTPTVGRINRFKLCGDRIDTGFSSGNFLTTNYDSLIAKLIITGKDREETIKKAIKACRETTITGIETNLNFLCVLLKKSKFVDGEHYTRIIDEYINTEANIFKRNAAYNIAIKYLFELINSPYFDPLKSYTSIQLKDFQSKKYIIGNEQYEVFAVEIIKNSIKLSARLLSEHDSTQSFVFSEISYDKFQNLLTYCCINDNGKIERDSASIFDNSWLKNDLGMFYISESSPKLSANKQKDISKSDSIDVVSSLPGKIVKINIKIGQKIVVGEEVLIIESMKMEHPIYSETEGVIESLNVAVGAFIEKDKVLATIKFI